MYRDTEKRGMQGLNMGQRNVDNYGAKLDRPSKQTCEDAPVNRNRE